MVAADSQSQMMATQSQVNSTTVIDPLHNPKHSPDHDHNNHHETGGPHSSYVFPSLGRQSSIYSLTLDEFQNTLIENGKNFGSMNMDEFLNSIWTAEESQANQNSNNHENQLCSVSVAASATSKGRVAKEPSLPRQGSLTLPAVLCKKTVDEVWTEIQKTDQHEDEQQQNHEQTVGNCSTQHQPTYREMTLEDFLIKAGVVGEQCGAGPAMQLAAATPSPPAHDSTHQRYGFSATQMGPTFVTAPMMGLGSYQPMPPSSSNGYGGFGPGAELSPVSPISPEGVFGPGQVDNTGGQYGLNMASLRGRKRIIDRPVEKVVERRQRRMIKNRESAARSRARKQAYTVELEAELNQLRNENAKLKLALAEIETQRKQQDLQVVLTRAQRAQDKLRAMRRTGSCNL